MDGFQGNEKDWHVSSVFQAGILGLGSSNDGMLGVSSS